MPFNTQLVMLQLPIHQHMSAKKAALSKPRLHKREEEEEEEEMMMVKSWEWSTA